MEIRVLFAVLVFLGVSRAGGDDYCLSSSVYEEKHVREGLCYINSRVGSREIVKYAGIEYLELTCVNSPGSKVFVKMVNKLLAQSDFSGVNVEQEVSTLKLLKGKRISPNFITCVFLSGNIAIIHEKVHDLLSSKEMRDKFSGFSLSKKLAKFLQVAIAIQTLHKNGMTYQSVSPEKIIALDPEMNDLRLYDFRDSLKPGDTGKGYSNFYFSPDKLKSYTFVATHNQDAYGFALTMINLLDEDEVLKTGIQNICHIYGNPFSDECKNVFQESLKKLVEKHQPTALYSYIEKHIFSNDHPLNINDLTEELFDIFDKISPTDGKKEPEVDGIVKALKSEFEANLKASNDPNKPDII